MRCRGGTATAAAAAIAASTAKVRNAREALRNRHCNRLTGFPARRIDGDGRSLVCDGAGSFRAVADGVIAPWGTPGAPGRLQALLDVLDACLPEAPPTLQSRALVPTWV